ncbi:MAG: branched-chain amino acid ABC transporter permease [Acidimicrobiia bacterium]
MDTVLDALVIGLFEAAPLVLAAMGFTLIYYLNGFINVAYAENLTMGAYFAIFFNTTLGLNFYVAIAPAAIMAGLLSVLTFLVVFQPAIRRGVGRIELIVMSVGVSFFIRHAARVVFGVTNKVFDFSDTSFFRVFGIGITSAQLTALVLVAVIAIALYRFIYKTDYGERMRALASNENLALVSGINPTRVSVLIWFFAGVAGGLAGIFFGVFSFVNYLLGWNLILIIIMITIIGGIGSVRGAMVAGIGAGIVTAAAVLTLPVTLYSQVLLLVLFILVLKVRGMRGSVFGARA